MQPIQSTFTDTYEVDCPHPCMEKVNVTITRYKGGHVQDITVKHVHEPVISSIPVFDRT